MRFIPEKVKLVFSSPSSSRKRDTNAPSNTDEDNSAGDGRLLDDFENGGGAIELSDAMTALQQSSSLPRPDKYVSPEKLLLKKDDADNNDDPSLSAGKETAADMMAYYNASSTAPSEGEIGGEEESIHQQRNRHRRKEKKKGHKFLFFCCDSKRAVIILNTFMCVLSSFVFTMALLNRDNSSSSNDNDISAYKQAMIMQGCGIFITFATILGAFWYSISVVCVGLLFTTYQLTMGIIKMTKFHWTYADTNSIVGVLLPIAINILLFYAEGLFISEISDGIMSDETYIKRERHSCCCTRCPC